MKIKRLMAEVAIIIFMVVAAITYAILIVSDK